MEPLVMWWYKRCRVPGADPGKRPGSPGPLFLAKLALLFYIVYNVWKIFLTLNVDFIVAEIRGVLGSVGGVCVCVSVWSQGPTRQISRFLSNIGGFRYRGRYCYLFCKGPILNDIRGHSDTKSICHIAENRTQFFNFFWGGGGPQTPGRRSRL